MTRRQGSPVTALCHDKDCDIMVTGDQSKNNGQLCNSCNTWTRGFLYSLKFFPFPDIEC